MVAPSPFSTPLHFAAEKFDREEIRRLIVAGFSLQEPTNRAGRRPVDLIADYMLLDLLDILVDIWQKEASQAQGTGFRFDGEANNTVLHYAAAYGNIAQIASILANKSMELDLNISNSKGETAAHWAAKMGNLESLQPLIEAGFSLQEPNDDGKRPVDLIADYMLPDLLNILLNFWQAQGTGFCFDGEAGNTVLHYAAAYGKIAQIDSLVAPVKRMKLDLNIKNSKGETPAHWAAETGNVEFLESHLSSFFDLQALDTEKNEPLAYAIRRKHMVFASKLVSTLGEKFNPTPFYKWANAEAEAEAKASSRMVGTVRVFGKVVMFGNALMKKKMKKEIKRISESKSKLNPPLLWTALHGKKGIAEFIVKNYKGALNEKDAHFQRTTLHWAAILGATSIVARLCMTEVFKQDLLPNLEDCFKKTALTYATELGHTEVINQLRELKSVQSFLEPLYKDRQVYIDSANAILVGAALIASVTFAGWLQPPVEHMRSMWGCEYFGHSTTCRFSLLLQLF